MNARVGTVECVAPVRGSAFSYLADVIRLTKPRITVMVIVTGLGGMWLAARTAGAAIGYAKALVALLGLVLIVSSANVLNMYIERDLDALMRRTKNRPLPAGRVAPSVALWFGLVIGLAALPLIAWQVNVLTAVLSAVSLVLYVLVYTPLKTRSPWALAVGAIPGAAPPLLGWTSATASIDPLGVALFAVLFFWQLPHFLAISTFRKDEYGAAGIKVFPAQIGERTTRLHAIAYLVALVIASLVLVPLGVGGYFYLTAAVALGLGFLIVCARDLGDNQAAIHRWARSVFFASLIYLPALIAAMMVGA